MKLTTIFIHLFSIHFDHENLIKVIDLIEPEVKLFNHSTINGVK